MTERLSPYRIVVPSTLTPRYRNASRFAMIWSMAVRAATNSDPNVAVCTVLCFLENQSTGVPLKIGGTQCMTTPDGYAFPLDIHDGLSYLQCRTYTDEEFAKLPHVIMTSDVTWEPSILDCTISSDDKWHNTVLDLGRSTSSNPFDEFGRYKQRQRPPIPLPVIGTPLRRAHPCQTLDIHYMITSTILDHVRQSSPTVNPQEHDFTTLRPFFLWVAPSLIAQTYEHTTQ
jgi:hypothetical protein